MLSQLQQRFSFLTRIELILLLVGLYLLTQTAYPDIVSDGIIRWQAVSALLNGEAIAPIKFSLVQPILSLPVAIVADLLGESSFTAVSYFNIIILFPFCFIIIYRLSQIYSYTLALRFALLLLSASFLPHHLQFYFGEVLSALAITCGILFLKNNPWLAIIFLAIGIANTPAMFVPFSILVVWLFFTQRTWSFYASLGIILAVFFTLGENYLKYGTWLDSPYLAEGEKGFQTFLPYSGLPGFSYPLFFGVISIIFSFGKGLIFFIPGLLITYHSKTRDLLKLNRCTYGGLIIFSAALILVYAKWWAWYGGSFWGPRFFLILVIPASLALAAVLQKSQGNHQYSLKDSLVFFGILTLSIWVGISGYVFGLEGLDLCWQDNYQLESLCWYTPEFSVLWRPFVTGSIFTLFERTEVNFVYWQLTIWLYFSYLIFKEHLSTLSITSFKIKIYRSQAHST